MTFDKDEKGRLISTGMIQLVDDGYVPDVGLQKVSTYETYGDDAHPDFEKHL